MKIGRIAYLNVLPFYHGLDANRWGPYVEGTPKFLGLAARDHKIDAAPLPLVDTFELEDTFEPLSHFGIACRGAVGSVILFSHQPFDRLSGCRLLFTGDSVTSIVLARQLLDRAGNTEYRIERGDDPRGYDGYLAIGDRALHEVRTSEFPVATDLSLRWFTTTGLPFVFARWVVRRTESDRNKTELAQALGQSLETPWRIEVPNRAGLDRDEARNYLNNMIYRLDASCLEAVTTFKANLHVVA
jgi:chorismate dehydratase